jgi:hypothetical protein
MDIPIGPFIYIAVVGGTSSPHAVIRLTLSVIVTTTSMWDPSPQSSMVIEYYSNNKLPAQLILETSSRPITTHAYSIILKKIFPDGFAHCHRTTMVESFGGSVLMEVINSILLRI